MGEMWQNGPCETCECSPMGQMCMHMDCYTAFMDPPCQNLVYNDGECCPICADEPVTEKPEEYFYPTKPSDIIEHADEINDTEEATKTPEEDMHFTVPMLDDAVTVPTLPPSDDSSDDTDDTGDDSGSGDDDTGSGDYIDAPVDYTCYSEHNKATYQDSESWSEGPCLTCQCLDGYTACISMACQPPMCQHYHTKPGHCCPTCLEDPEPEFTSWGKWSECHMDDNTQTCGQGTQMRERELLPAKPGQAQYIPASHETLEEKNCFVPCEDPVEECPSDIICDHLAPVCGSAQPGPASTFKSECHLNLAACRAGHAPALLYAGECNPDDDLPVESMCQRDGPVKTSVKYSFNDTLEECVGPVTDVKTCASLLCGGGSASCCKATDFEPVEVLVSCYSARAPREFLRFRKHIHYSATRCECQDSNAP